MASLGSGPLTTAVLVLSMYAASVSLVLYNKWLLSVHDFHFPLSMTACHMGLSGLIARFVSRNNLPELSWSFYLRVVVPTGLFTTLDVALSNEAFLFVAVSYMEMVKSAAPVSVLLMGWCAGLSELTASLFGVVMLISSGVAMASYGEEHFSATGFMFLVLATLSCGVRVLFMQKLVQAHLTRRDGSEFRLDVFAALAMMMPVAVSLMVPVALIFEAGPLVDSGVLTGFNVGLVLMGAVLAFMLHFTMFMLIQHTSALTSVIAGIFKTSIILFASVVFFKDKVTLLNGIGFAVTMTGVVCYTYIKYTSTKTHPSCHPPASKQRRAYAQLDADAEMEDLTAAPDA